MSRSPALQALFVTFLWSTSWVLIKIGLSDDLPPLTFAGLRYSLAALVLCAALASSSLLGRLVNRDAHLSPLVVTAPSMAIGGVVTLTAGLLLDGVPTLTPTAWAIVVWLALVNTAYAFTLWNHTLRSLTATESAAINNTMLVQIAVLAWLVLGESLVPRQWLALAVASTGIWLVRRRPGQAIGT